MQTYVKKKHIQLFHNEVAWKELKMEWYIRQRENENNLPWKC